MIDLNQVIGQDLSASSTGDVLTVTGPEMGRQRVLRRLLTNPGDYIFHPEYGAGIGRLVGSLADNAKIRALIRGQMLLEAAVAQSPEPVVSITNIQAGIQCDIQYTDAPSGQTVGLSFNVTN